MFIVHIYSSAWPCLIFQLNIQMHLLHLSYTSTGRNCSSYYSLSAKCILDKAKLKRIVTAKLKLNSSWEWHHHKTVKPSHVYFSDLCTLFTAHRKPGSTYPGWSAFSFALRLVWTLSLFCKFISSITDHFKFMVASRRLK